MGFFFNKKLQDRKPSINILPVAPAKVEKKDDVNKTVSNKTKKDNMVENIDKVSALEEIVTDEKPVKRVKKDKGLIERTESSKVILTEDNKQLLMD